LIIAEEKKGVEIEARKLLLSFF